MVVRSVPGVPMLQVRKWAGAPLLAGVGLVLALALLLADQLLAGPMRRWAERTMNARLQGYTVRIGRVRPHLWRLAFSLHDLVLVQDRHPEPPVADLGALRFSLRWRDLLALKLTGDLVIDRPALHLNLAQLQAEARGGVPIQDRGWQPAVESVYPFKLNRVEVRDGSVLYLAADTAARPLRLTRLRLVARNIRNLRAARGTYPSPVELDAALFDTGAVHFAGAADFLRTPHAAAQGEFRLERVPLDRLDPLARDVQMRTAGGLLSADGRVEYAPGAQTAHLREVLVEDLRLDYLTSAATRARELARARAAAAAARRVRNAPALVLRIDTLRLVRSQVGFADPSAKPPYRLFLADASLRLDNLGNQASQGRTTFEARGTFMGSGAAVATGGFQTPPPARGGPPGAGPDFDLHLRLEDANLPDLNPFLLANAGVDVARGRITVFTEITARDGRVEGYLKPLVKDLKVYDRRKDQAKPFGKRVEMHVLQFLAGLFRNPASKQVATVARFSGSTADPRFRTWEAVRQLLRNGFIQAIRPGFLGGGGQPPRTAPPPAAKPPAKPDS